MENDPTYKMNLKNRKIKYSFDSQRVCSPMETLKLIAERSKDVFDLRIKKHQNIFSPSLMTYEAINKDYTLFKGKTSTLGKGLTRSQALASATMEYIERFSYSNFFRDPKNKIIEDYNNLKKDDVFLISEIISKEHEKMQKYGNYSARFHKYLRDEKNNKEWIKAFSLKKQKEVLIPYSISKGESTNGLASGNCIEEAIIHSFYEVIERDTCFDNLKEISRQELSKNTFLNIQDIPKKIKNKFNISELNKIPIIYSRSRLCPSIHIFQSCIFFKDKKSMENNDPPFYSQYAGANLDPVYSLVRCLTETSQGMSYAKAKDILKFNLNQKNKIKFSDLKNFHTDDIIENLNYCLSELNLERDVLIIDLTHPIIKIPVVKCIITDSYSVSIPKINKDGLLVE